jgi:hypothetical protein
MTITYNQIIQLFSNLANAHKLIKAFNHGDVAEIESDLEINKHYPKIWVVPTSARIVGNTVQTTFNILCFDLVHKDESNETEVLSDTQLILFDVIKSIKHLSGNYFDVIGQTTLTPFTERFGEWVSGWNGILTVETDYNEQGCDIPIELFQYPAADEDSILISPYLRCETLAECITFQELEQRINDLEQIVEQDTLDSVTDRGNTTTNSIDVGGVITDYIQFDITQTGHTSDVGKIVWNSQKGVLEYKLDGGLELEIGEKQVIRVVNKTSTNLLKSEYRVVKITGAQGQRPKIEFAQADTEVNHKDTIGIVAQNI